MSGILVKATGQSLFEFATENLFLPLEITVERNVVFLSAKEHSRWEKMNLPYGYLWWIIEAEEHACAAMGDGGNVIYFNTKKKIVISITSLFMQNAKDRIKLIKEHIEPIFEHCE